MYFLNFLALSKSHRFFEHYKKCNQLTSQKIIAKILIFLPTVHFSKIYKDRFPVPVATKTKALAFTVLSKILILYVNYNTYLTNT